MTKVKVFVHATNADPDADAEGYDISSPDIRPGSLKMQSIMSLIINMNKSKLKRKG